MLYSYFKVVFAHQRPWNLLSSWYDTPTELCLTAVFFYLGYDRLLVPFVVTDFVLL